MRCPKCSSEESKVVDSRQAEDAIRRRRVCESCGFRFTTFERIEEMPLLVIKKDDKREPFNREKIVRGLVRSAYKRPVSSEDIETTVANVERKIRQLDSNEVESDFIGEFVMQELAELDDKKSLLTCIESLYTGWREIFVKSIKPPSGIERQIPT